MAYTLEEIKELVETLTPIIKNAIEAGSLSVEDLRVAESMDFVNSLPALEEKGLNVSFVRGCKINSVTPHSLVDTLADN